MWFDTKRDQKIFVGLYQEGLASQQERLQLLWDP